MLKKFLVKALVFIATIAAVFLLISFQMKPRMDVDTAYMATIIDKHQRLSEIDSNRLILAGGSNLVFGVDSRRIQDSLGYKVTNLGLHAGLGPVFILNELISEVKQNDIVVLCLEYPLFDANYTRDAGLLENVTLAYPSAASYYSLTFEEKSSNAFQRFRRFFTPAPGQDHVYSRKAFNEFGDLVAHLSNNQGNRHFDDPMTAINSIGAIDEFTRLGKKCKELGARLYLVFPNYPRSQYDANKPIIDDIYSKVRTDLGFIPVLGNPQTFLVDDSELFDTVYHLNNRGRARRTDLLISLLKANIL